VVVVLPTRGYNLPPFIELVSVVHHLASVRFVILAVPRTGSNLLCTLLNSHLEILCHHEIFNPQGIFFALEHRDGTLDLGSMEQRDSDPLRFLDRVWDCSLGYPCVGFKFTRGQNPIVLDHVLTDSSITKILLRRQNRIRTFVSELLAEQTGVWEAYADDDLASEPRQVHVSIDNLRSHVVNNDRFYADIYTALASSGQDYSELVYEKLLLPDEQRRALNFLGFCEEQPKLKAASVRQNSRTLREVIANFSELDALLEGGEYHAELHDTVN